MICCVGFDTGASVETNEEVSEHSCSDNSIQESQTCDSSIQVVWELPATTVHQSTVFSLNLFVMS